MSLSNLLIECRSELDGNSLVGHAAVFEQPTNIGPYDEVLSRGAFDAVIANPDTDVRALYNHDPAQLLARQSSGTLQLDIDDSGLAFRLDIPDTSYGRDIKALVQRGDLRGASFGFIPGKEEWQSNGSRQVRRHHSVERLIDISIVPFPAYEGTDVSLRNLPAAVRNAREQMIRARARILFPTKG